MTPETFRFTRTQDGGPVARYVHVYLKPIENEQKLRLAKERFSKMGFESSEVVPGAMWEVATNVWAAYEPEALGGFGFYEPLPAPVSLGGVLFFPED